MKFSIIIPAYNASRYICDCLDSLLAQDFPKHEYEVIVVDDSSTDDTAKIVAERYINVKLLRHEQNRRQGGARNTGLKAAVGEYVIFLDADDYWNANNTLSVMSRLLDENPCLEVLRSDAINPVAQNSCVRSVFVEFGGNITIMSGKEHLSSDGFFYEIVTSAYLRVFLIKNKLWFRENVSFEDSDWTVKMLWYAATVGLYSYPFYNYRYNPDSTTVKSDLKKFRDNVKSISEIDDFVHQVDMPQSCEFAVYTKVKRSILSFIHISRLYSVKDSVACIKGIRRSLLKDTWHYRMTMFDRVRFCMLRNCPWLLVGMVRCLTLTKRFVLKCVRR